MLRICFVRVQGLDGCGLGPVFLMVGFRIQGVLGSVFSQQAEFMMLGFLGFGSGFAGLGFR